LAYVFITSPARLAAAPEPQGHSAEGQTLHILVNKSVVINLPTRLQRVLASNPAVIDVLATTPNQVVVEGKAAGSSSLILWDESAQSQMLDVVVDLDVTSLRTALEHAYPDQQISVQADGARLLLWGSASEPRVAEDVTKMAAAYSTSVVNSLTVPVSHERQVSLSVKFAEVDRTRMEQFGINLLALGAGNTLATTTTGEYGPPTGTTGASSGATLTGSSGSSLSVPNLLNILIFRPDINMGATLQDLEEKSILQILAEPNVMALNGQKASFLEGGEFPFPVVQGGANIGAVTIQFRPYGVKLEFTPTIGKDNVIRLHEASEVSTLDFTNAVTISGFTVPALATRRAETEIELKDGQSFEIAGLLDHRATMQLSKIAGIGDLPILGAFFRSKSVQRSTNELVVVVTPHITDPVRKVTPPPVDPKLSIPYLDLHKFERNVPEHKKVDQPTPASGS
jgi:pilus assembly protein CpaC